MDLVGVGVVEETLLVFVVDVFDVSVGEASFGVGDGEGICEGAIIVLEEEAMGGAFCGEVGLDLIGVGLFDSLFFGELVFLLGFFVDVASTCVFLGVAFVG